MTALTAPFFLQQLTDTSGKPLSNGKLFSYVGGSTNLPKPIYYDKDYTTPCPNPLIADASGILPQYFMTSGYYKFEVKTEADIIIATRDYIDAGGGSGTGTVDDHKVMSTSLDPIPNYLSEKLIGGTSIQIGTVTLPNTDVKTTITDDGRIPVSQSDSQIGYLNQKIVSSSSIIWETLGSVNKQMVATVDETYGNVIPVWCIFPDSYPTTTPPFGLGGADLAKVYEFHYGVAMGTLNPASGDDLAIWYLEGGTYWGDATWVSKSYNNGIMILNADHGEYDSLHVNPGDITNDENLSNYPAGLYILKQEGDGYHWMPLVVNVYPKPVYDADAVLTYNGVSKTFYWTAKDAFVGKGSVRIDANDSANYLGYKVQAGAGIAVTDTPNGAFGRFLSISSTGSNPTGKSYASTMYVASAIQTIAPNMIARSELICLFVPTTDVAVIQGISTQFGLFCSQGGAGELWFTLRDSQYRLIATSYMTLNPTSQVFLESGCGQTYDPVTGLPVARTTLTCGGRYYLGINWSANGMQFLGDEALQTNNTQPYTAYKVDNLTGIPAQLVGGGESKMRPFVRLLSTEP